MSGLKVLVVGASIAGPTAAYWLARAGATVTVIERWPHLRPGGHNIDLRTSGITVMRRMEGMETAVRAAKLELDSLNFVNDDNKVFAKFVTTGNTDEQSLISEYEIYRGDLARILYDMTKDDPHIKYIFGEQVASIQQRDDDGPVHVDFMNGLPGTDFDLVVACDGSTSRTRAIGLNCGVRDHIHPTNGWAAYFSIDGKLLPDSRHAFAWSSIPGRFYAMIADAASSRTRIGLMSLHPKADAAALNPFREAMKQGNDALKTYVAKRFASSSWRVPEILQGLKSSDDFYVTEIVQVKVPKLYKGRFVLVGDAGYGPGPTGAGTSLALTGAYILAGEINNHGMDVSRGLEAYENFMKPVIKEMQQIPPGIFTVLAPQTRWGLWMRNLVLSVITFFLRFSGMFSWLGRFYSVSFGGDKYNLPEYKWKR